MTFDFWVGFEKRAGSLLDSAKRGIRAAAKKKPVPVAHTIDYSGTAFTKKPPKVLDAAGKDLAAKAPVPPPPPRDIHAEAAEVIAKRRQAMHQGQHTHSQVQEALKEKVKD